MLALAACGIQDKEQKVEETHQVNKITKYGSVSVLAVDVETREKLVSENPSQRMTPASLTKVLTTGAALNNLSPDYRFETRFYIQKTGQGHSLLVKGGGDPTLGSDRFESSKAEKFFKQLLSELRKHEVSRVTKLVVDNSCYSGVKQPSKRMWEDMGNYYGAVPNGLSYLENTFFLTMRSPSEIDAPVSIVSIKPSINRPVRCFVKSANNNKDSAYIYGIEEMKEWYVSGTIPRNRKMFTIKGALSNPELVFGNELKAFLAEKGIEINDVAKENLSTTSGYEHIYTHYSPELNKVVGVVNKMSHNLYADHLLYELAINQNTKANWDNGTKALLVFWKKQIPGFTGQFYDGSGLSPFNAFSASDMVDALIYMQHSLVADQFKESLSVAGVNGTLRSICTDDAYKGKVIGKSGSMNGVLGYCGYIKTNAGRTIAFCVMANRFTEPFKTVRANMEQMMQEIIKRY
ncbi:MAG: D-alanyl-D-alanine carboxypeptidase/D-alanyl-D-alanine-endopeptidase [Carboxylicivirga sp.]|nr:D-alanyl-D-alanine carboxypeptidase/D-alanyl-D-alanine-endopeptidase [Carboxylicivirga sp.]